MQTVLVLLLVALSVAYLVRKLRQEFSGKGSCESCGIHQPVTNHRKGK